MTRLLCAVTAAAVAVAVGRRDQRRRKSVMATFTLDPRPLPKLNRGSDEKTNGR